MFDDNDVRLFVTYLRSTPEQRKEYWKALEDLCEENGLAKGFYCPYVPLQIVSANGTNVKIKTRYDND